MKAALICVLVTGGAFADTPIQFKDLPAPVQKTAEQESKGATVKGYQKEVEKGKTFYELETLVNGKTRDVLIDASGAVVEVEQQIDLASVPPAARKTLERSGKVLTVESVTKGNVMTYEASVSKGGKKTEVKVTAEGQPVKE